MEIWSIPGHKLKNVYITQWLFRIVTVRDLCGDLYLLLVRESRIFVGFLCNCLFLPIQNIMFVKMHWAILVSSVDLIQTNLLSRCLLREGKIRKRRSLDSERHNRESLGWEVFARQQDRQPRSRVSHLPAPWSESRWETLGTRLQDRQLRRLHTTQMTHFATLRIVLVWSVSRLLATTLPWG